MDQVEIDRGYFPVGESVLRTVHERKVVGSLYGQRALLVQACHPLAFAGLSVSSGGADAPFRRLVRTAQTMEVVFFGTRAAADRETARVRMMHEHVKGVIPEQAGPHPAGSAYRADAPEFLLWILACLADSAQAVFERFERPLTGPERARYWQDYVMVGEMFGLSPGDAPADYDEYRAYMSERLESDDLFVTEEARRVGHGAALELPLPLSRRAALPAINLAVVGTLPPRVRDLYGLPWGPLREMALRGLVAQYKLTGPIMPRRFRVGPSTDDYEIIAKEEARRGEPPHWASGLSG